MTNVSVKPPSQACASKIYYLLQKNDNIKITNFSNIGNSHYSYTVTVNGESEAAEVGSVIRGYVNSGTVSVISYTYGSDYIGLNILEHI